MNGQNESGTGSMIGIIIVILIIVVGGIYFFNQRIEKQKQMNASTDTTSVQDYNALAGDASSMSFDTLGAGVDQLK